MNISNKKTAFSLAETLIAVLIIGIMAVILIPMLNKTTPDKNKVVLRKAYTNLAQAVTTMINDDVNYPGTQVTDPGNIPRGFNYTNAVPNGNGTTNKFCYFLSDLMNTVGASSCPDNSFSGMYTSPIFTTSDGITWYLYLAGNDTTGADTQFKIGSDSAAYATKVIIDVNGPNKGTNCAADGLADVYKPSGGNPAYSKCVSSDTTNFPCQKNPDTFYIGIRYDGKLYAGSIAYVDYCAINILSNPSENTKSGN